MPVGRQTADRIHRAAIVPADGEVAVHAVHGHL